MHEIREIRGATPAPLWACCAPDCCWRCARRGRRGRADAVLRHGAGERSGLPGRRQGARRRPGRAQRAGRPAAEHRVPVPQRAQPFGSDAAHLFGEQTTDRSYRSSSSSLTLQQPIFDYEAISSYYYGVAQARHADERFRSRSQELAVRVAQAYMDACMPPTRSTWCGCRSAYEAQKTQNERWLAAGEAIARMCWRPRRATTWRWRRRSRRRTTWTRR